MQPRHSEYVSDLTFQKSTVLILILDVLRQCPTTSTLKHHTYHLSPTQPDGFVQLYIEDNESTRTRGMYVHPEVKSEEQHSRWFTIKVQEELTRFGGNSLLEVILATLHVEDDQ